MNEQSDHRTGKDIELLRTSTKSLLINKNRHDSNLNILRSGDINRDQQKKEVLNNYYKISKISDSHRDTDSAVTTRYQNDKLFNEELNSPSQSICSRYLKRETNGCRVPHESREIQRDPRRAHKGNTDCTPVFEECTTPREQYHYIGRERFCSDKTTYCRPVVNLYNQQFLYRTIEKNVRLRRLLKEIIITRHREKEAENWNNYINELKEKHCNYVKMRSHTSLYHIPEELVTPESIEDYYNTKFMCKKSNPCQHLLQDFYEVHGARQSHDEQCNSSQCNRLLRCNPFDRNPLCYPTSSQGRFILLERERQKRIADRIYKPIYRSINEDKSDKVRKRENKSLEATNQKCLDTKNIVDYSTRATNTSIETSCTQTDRHVYPEIHNKEIIKANNLKNNELSSKLSTEPETVQENIKSNGDNLKDNSLASIAEKLDGLISSINSFIVELKTKQCFQSSNRLNRPTKLKREKVSITKSDSFGIAKKEKAVCGYVDSSTSTKNSSEINFNKLIDMENNLNEIDRIILKEIETDKFVQWKDSSVGEIRLPCSVKISVSIPTKEISTEVTSSLSKAEYSAGDKKVFLQEIKPYNEHDKRIAIAVNTDPVSLLALLRTSTEETIKRILSFVPSIDYYYYLSRLQSPQPREFESDYICNICGAAFNKPSQLSDHIQRHELGRTRDCCVCRHVLDMPRRRPGLFKCQYCGQRFTRAYCCELHQQSCAKRLGRIHDVASSLMLLR